MIKDNPGLGPIVRQTEHRWSPVLESTHPNESVDRVDACLDCGTVRHTYEHGSQVAPGYPRYFGNMAQHRTVEDERGMPEAVAFWGTTEELPCRILEW